VRDAPVVGVFMSALFRVHHRATHVRTALRFALGVGLGASALAVYLLWVGPGRVVTRLTGLVPLFVLAVAAFVVAEGLTDSLGVWASVEPLGDGLTAGQSVQFALAGDFFDTLSPAGPVSSEPIMARFIGVTTETTYTSLRGRCADASRANPGETADSDMTPSLRCRRIRRDAPSPR